MTATLIFFAVTVGAVAVWNRCFTPVPRRIVVGVLAAVVLYQSETLFTSKVDLPGALAFHAYPWRALGREPVRANTGITFQELIPWTETARQIVKSGEVPLWNRRLGSGTPLLSDHQNSIAHPFTLLGLFLPIGKAWTLSVSLRLFLAVFFFCVFLRSWGFHDGAAFFGAIAYGFSTFHVIALTSTIGLTMMSLPVTLAATDEVMRRPRGRSFAFLIIALMMAVLGGHPESEYFVGLTTGAYALYLAAALKKVRPLVVAALAAVAALLLTAFFWYPALAAIPLSNRYALMTALREHGRLEHSLGTDWFTVLLAPNILGTVPGGSYRPPEPQYADLLSDYGEVASAYTGIVTIALAGIGLTRIRRQPAAFAVGAAVVALLMITEAPGWHDLIQRMPLLNVSLSQRFRFLWNLGVVLLAVIGFDAFLRRELSRRRVVCATLITATALIIVLAIHAPRVLPRMSLFEEVQLFAPVIILLCLPIAGARALAVSLLVFIDLVLATWRYNPPSVPEDIMPVTGAIAAMKTDGGGQPYRVVATGWSFLADTPGYYGLEDVRSTSAFTSPEYLRLFTGYFAAQGFDQVVGTTRYPFCDYLNVRYIYAPPGHSPGRDDAIEVYRGIDGSVFRNEKALPRYFLVRRYDVEPSFSMVVARLKQEVADYRERAFVDHIPHKTARLAGAIPHDTRGGEVRVRRYGPNDVELDVNSRGWNLLVSSDAWWPGWRAYWNGERMPPVRVNGAFVGVFTPPGRGIVRLRYRPKEVDVGVSAAVVTFVILMSAAVLRGFHRLSTPRFRG